jgi:hypothetical protein
VEHFASERSTNGFITVTAGVRNLGGAVSGPSELVIHQQTGAHEVATTNSVPPLNPGELAEVT